MPNVLSPRVWSLDLTYGQKLYTHILGLKIIRQIKSKFSFHSDLIFPSKRNVKLQVLPLYACLKSICTTVEPLYKKTNNLHMRKQSHRSAARLISNFVFAP